MNIVLYLCAGQGSRMEASVPKQFISVCGKPLFSYAYETFASLEEIDAIAFVVSKENLQYFQENISCTKPIFFIPGGDTRGESVYQGLTFLKEHVSMEDLILIHDSARALIDKETILNNLKCAQKNGNAITSIEVVDSVLYGKEEVEKELNREELFLAQTPQSFYLKDIWNAYTYAKKKNFSASDDASIALFYGQKIYKSKGNIKNFKITTKEDLKRMRLWLEKSQ